MVVSETDKMTSFSPLIKKRRAIRVSEKALIRTDRLEGLTYPLVVEPTIEGLNLASRAESNERFIQAHLNKYGAILFRGFRLPEIDDFEHFVRVSGGEPLSYTERSSPRSQVNGKVYTSTDHPAAYPIFLHNEQSYNQTFPTRIYFHCRFASKVGGSTPLADTRRVFSRLSTETRERFEQLGYMYVRNFGEVFGLSWQTAFQTSSPSEVEAYCRANGIHYEWKDRGHLRTWQVRRVTARHPISGEPIWFNHATFFHISTLEPPLPKQVVDEFGEDALPNQTYYGNGEAIPVEVLRELREAYLAEKISFPWRDGDVLMLDNLLCAHGREPYAGKRRVLVSMAKPCAWSQLEKVATGGCNEQ